jgi:ABC-type nickel/cobalt efflux system permease component RcnA
MTIVVVLALASLVALLVAILTGSTFVAVIVIALAALGILLLVRDWRAERRQSASAGHDDATAEEHHAAVSDEARMSPDMFSPDITIDGDGPSSDARADSNDLSDPTSNVDA